LFEGFLKYSYNCFVEIFLTMFGMLKNTELQYVSDDPFFIFLFFLFIFLFYTTSSHLVSLFWPHWILNLIFQPLKLHKILGWFLFSVINLNKIWILVLTKQLLLLYTKYIFKNVVVFKLYYFSNTFLTYVIFLNFLPNSLFSKKLSESPLTEAIKFLGNL
jgi:hypothetical protein